MARVPGLTHADLVSPVWEVYARLLERRGSAPGVISRHRLGPHTLLAALDDAGAPVGILLVRADDAGAPLSLHVVVHRAARRRGIATALYARAARAGVDIEALSKRNGLTPDGAAFRRGRRTSEPRSPPARAS